MRRLGIFSSAIALSAALNCSSPALARGGGGGAHGGGGLGGGGFHGGSFGGMRSLGNKGFEGRSVGLSRGFGNSFHRNGFRRGGISPYYGYDNGPCYGFGYGYPNGACYPNY